MAKGKGSGAVQQSTTLHVDAARRKKQPQRLGDPKPRPSQQRPGNQGTLKPKRKVRQGTNASSVHTLNSKQADWWARLAPITSKDAQASMDAPEEMRHMNVARKLIAQKKNVPAFKVSDQAVVDELVRQRNDPNGFKDADGKMIIVPGPFYEEMSPTEEMFLEEYPEWYDAVVSTDAFAPGNQGGLDAAINAAIERALALFLAGDPVPSPPRPYNKPENSSEGAGVSAGGGNGAMDPFKFWGQLGQGLLQMLPQIIMALGAAAGG